MFSFTVVNMNHPKESRERAVAEVASDCSRVVRLLKNPLKLGRSFIATPCSTRCSEWSQWPGLNRRPTVYETVALPLSYIGLLRSPSHRNPSGLAKRPYSYSRNRASGQELDLAGRLAALPT